MKIIREVEAGDKRRGAIAKEYGIPNSTLSTILKNKTKILDSAESGVSGNKFRSKPAEYPEVEK